MRKKQRFLENNRNYVGKKLTASTPFAVQEAFRTMRANISYASADAGKRVYGFTSANACEGKSVLTANLAISFAMLEKKILLIDADMRRPSQSLIFADEVKKGQNGLAEYLAGLTKDIADCLVPCNGLTLMPSGQTPPNPAEMLASARMRELIETLSAEYDYIFIDLPPICQAADAAALAPALTGCYLVVRSGICEARDIEHAKEMLDATGARLCGVILNDVESTKSSYYAKQNYYADNNIGAKTEKGEKEQ